MAKSNRNSPDEDAGSFNFDKLFRNGHPLLQPQHLDKLLPDASWVESYVKDMLKNTLSRGGQPTDSLSGYEVFETHRSVIVRVRIPSDTDETKLRVFQSPGGVKIAGLPGGKKLEIQLPVTVSIRNSRSKLKDGILEIRMPKDGRDDREHEIFIEM